MFLFLLHVCLHYKLSSLHAFLHTNLLHVRCVFAALLHLKKHNGWRGRWTLWRVNRLFLFLLDVCLHTNLPSCPLHIRRCYLGKNRLVGQEDELFCATTEGSVVQSSKRYTNCAGKLNIQIRWGHIILDLKMMAW
jgi:hypothetical protein